MQDKNKEKPKTTVRVYSSDYHHIKILAAVENIHPIDLIAQMVQTAVSKNPHIKNLTTSINLTTR